jgi:hypothetical protein
VNDEQMEHADAQARRTQGPMHTIAVGSEQEIEYGVGRYSFIGHNT